MKDLSSSKINWPIPNKALGGNGSPFANSTNGAAWNDFANATNDNNTTGEELLNHEGSEPSGEGGQ